jgi:thymidylate synthase
MDSEWVRTLQKINESGREVAPRGKLTLEVLHNTVHVDMRRPVLTNPSRRLSYQFMAAEAYWILSGDNTVAGISPWNKHISEFSDDGKTFFGAYGPKVISQIGYVVRKLIEDRESRQAGLTIWREKPPQTKDVPCTVAIFFSIRDDLLDAHVFMRSSDVWLGLPYDCFNFSMLGHQVCGLFNDVMVHEKIAPGQLHLTAVSSHLYQPQWSEAREIAENSVVLRIQPSTPSDLYSSSKRLMDYLVALRETKAGDKLRWWEYAPNA